MEQSELLEAQLDRITRLQQRVQKIGMAVPAFVLLTRSFYRYSAEVGMCISFIGLVATLIILNIHLRYLKQLEKCTNFPSEDAGYKLQKRMMKFMHPLFWTTCLFMFYFLKK